MKFSLLILIVGLLVSPVWAKKYAVIVNGGDNGQSGENANQDGSILRQHFSTLAQRDADYYQAKGFEVIIIDANKGAKTKDLVAQVSALKDAEELSVSVFAHGLVKDANKAFFARDYREQTGTSIRFPRGYVRPDELEARTNGPLKTNSNVFGFFMAGVNGARNDLIGMGDLHHALARAKLENPDMHTTVKSLACYGGNAIRAIESIPDTQFFSASGSTAPSLILYDGPLGAPSTQLADYTQYLMQAQTQSPSMLAAHLKAKALYDEFALTKAVGITTSRPLNSIELHFADMCLGAPQSMAVPICQFTSSSTKATLELTRSVGQIQLTQFMRESLAEEKRFWQSIKSKTCFPERDAWPLPASLVEAFKKESAQFFEKVGAPQAYRNAVQSWQACVLAFDCDYYSLRDRLSSADFSKAFLMPTPEEGEKLLSELCAIPKKATNKAGQAQCIVKYGATRPGQALMMFAAMMNQIPLSEGQCRQAELGLTQNSQLQSCLNNLNQRGDEAFWEHMLNLLQLGSKKP